MKIGSGLDLEIEIRENITPRGDGNFKMSCTDTIYPDLDKREYNSERRRKLLYYQIDTLYILYS